MYLAYVDYVFFYVFCFYWFYEPKFYKYDGRKLWLNDQPDSGHGHLFYGN
jgi:hypothetical protein